MTLTKEPYHSICSSSDEQVAVVVEGHAVDTNWEGLEREGALSVCVCVRACVSACMCVCVCVCVVYFTIRYRHFTSHMHSQQQLQ